MANTNIGSAYVQIIPDTKGFGSKLKDDIGAPLQKQSKESGDEFGGGLSSGILGKLKWGAIFAGAVVAAKQVGTAAAQTIGNAFNNYSNYEQLVGGIDTLFKGASEKVQGFAANAYKTAGMDANAYMENVTAFSASLIQGLGGDTDKAADVANRAMSDMSDNANKMGTSIESITQTYQSLARGNYAMLDNLKLGYGGTKSELQRLIADSSKMTDVQKELGVSVDSSSMSFDNIINAISVMQSHLGITGTTAKEASSTIEGSFTMVKASWQNLLTELGKEDGDVSGKFSEFGDSLATAVSNAAPRILEIIGNLLTQIPQKVPALMAQVFESVRSSMQGTLLGDILNWFSEVGAKIQEFMDAFGIKETIDAIADAFGRLTEGMGAAFGEGAQASISPIAAIIAGIAKAVLTVIQVVIEIANVVKPIIGAIIAVIKGIVTVIITVVKTIISVITGIVTTAINVGKAIGDFAAAIPEFFASIPEKIAGFFSSVFDFITAPFTAAVDFISGIPDQIIGFFKSLPTKIATLFLQIQKNNIKTWLTVINFVKTIPARIVAFFRGIGGKIVSAFGNLRSLIGSKFTGVVNFVKSIPGKILAFFKGIGSKLSGFFGSFKIKLPHFSITPAGWKISDLLKGKIPKLGIQWYAQGGIFDSPSIIGVGEAGREAVVPLDRLPDLLGDDVRGGGIVINLNYNKDEDATQITRDIARQLKLYGYAAG